MGKSNCAAVSCTNSTYKLNKWKKEICTTHHILHQDCTCQPPFKLYFFPSQLRNSEPRERWIRAMKRVSKNNAKWVPTASDRVCSDHFVDDEPTIANPDPTSNLGYEVGCKKPRRALFRKPLPVKRKLCISTKDCQFSDLSVDSDTGAGCSSSPAQQQRLELVSPTSSISSFWSDHTYCTTPATESCAKCADQAELIKSLIRKLNKVRRQTFSNIKSSNFTWKKIKTDAKIRFYTGFTSIAQFNAIFNLLQPYLPKIRYWRGPKRASTKVKRNFQTKKSKILSHQDEFLLTLMRLRLGLLNEDLADRFGVSPTICSNTFTTWIRIISRILGGALVNWLPLEPIRENLPECFKKMGYHKCRVILDCAEVFVERPKSLQAQAVTWSDYKHHNTLKFLVGIAPCGYVTFLSNCYGGRASDKHIVNDSGFFELLERDDQVMADRGFQIKEELLLKFCSLAVPPGARAKSQFTEKEVKNTKEIANLRIHVERAINRIKHFRILKSVLPISMLHHADDLVLSCAALCNLKDMLIK